MRTTIVYLFNLFLNKKNVTFFYLKKYLQNLEKEK